VSAAAQARGRIGPNAITRLAEALRADVGEDGAARLFRQAGMGDYLLHPPEQMVEEVEVARLHRTLRETFPGEDARRLSLIAGVRTGDYLLAHRIPRPVQAILKMLPAPFASYVLLSAIRRHAWTFAGSGAFFALADNPTKLVISNNPMCRGVQSAEPTCHYYAATFERLFNALVHPNARVRETACEACGAGSCVFEVGW